MKDLVFVDASDITPSLKLSYAVLCDQLCSVVDDFARENPKCIVVVFATKTVEEANDYSSLDSDFIVKPFYVGNLKPKELMMKAWIETIIGSIPGVEWTCIRDDRTAE